VREVAQRLRGNRLQQDVPQRLSRPVKGLGSHVMARQQRNAQKVILRMVQEQILRIET